ncbi:MAG: glycosyltransferase family 2 protein [Acidisphaera sp.]|nr:glycosyltransferase family 2 protein [Acidisphaera sp.]
MSKSPLAIVTMAYNEPDFLPIWLKYYAGQVGLEQCYIVDHGSDDRSTFGLAPANIIRIPRSPLDEYARANFISAFCGSLLTWYEHVAYTDVDEILVADPRHHESLIAFCAEAKHDITTAFGMHVAHSVPDEPELAPMGKILRQRKWALGVGSMSKPTLIRRPVQWTAGFHYSREPSRFDDLFLFHIAYCDLDIVRRRQRKRRATSRVEETGGGHHDAEEDAFLTHLKSWSDMPRFDGVDLGRDCPVRAAHLAKMFRTQAAGNSENEIDVMVSGDGLWRIPERFADSV